jgi:hypothetical protein
MVSPHPGGRGRPNMTSATGDAQVGQTHRMQAKRVLIPFCLLALLALLTVGAAALGLSQSPTLYFPTVPSNDPHAQSSLDLAVERTAAAASFTWRVPHSVGFGETLIYNAPDEIHDYLGSSPATEAYGVGSIYYFRASDYYEDNAPSTSWVKMIDPAGYSDARTYAMKFLRILQQASSVNGGRGRFVAYDVESDYPIAAGDLGDVLVVTVSKGGYVASIRATVTGLYPGFSAHLVTTHSEVEFHAVGSSPEIEIPAARTVRGQPPPCGPATSGVTFCPT